MGDTLQNCYYIYLIDSSSNSYLHLVIRTILLKVPLCYAVSNHVLESDKTGAPGWLCRLAG